MSACHTHCPKYTNLLHASVFYVIYYRMRSWSRNSDKSLAVCMSSSLSESWPACERKFSRFGTPGLGDCVTNFGSGIVSGAGDMLNADAAHRERSAPRLDDDDDRLASACFLGFAFLPVDDDVVAGVDF